MNSLPFQVATQDTPLPSGTSACCKILSPRKALSKVHLPLFACKVAAGFPSPAADYIDKTLDLNELLVAKPAATYFVRVQGNSMINAGIHPNDILVVDRSIDPLPGKIVICALNSEITVKRLVYENEQWKLRAENQDYPDFNLNDDLELIIWGVVTSVIHMLGQLKIQLKSGV